MDTATSALLLAFISAVIGLGSLVKDVYKARSAIRKDTAETEGTQSLAHKTDVEALSLVLDSLREDYDRLDGIVTRQQVTITKQQTTIDRLDATVAAWKRRFERVCQQTNLNAGEFITRPLGNLSDGVPVGSDEPNR